MVEVLQFEIQRSLIKNLKFVQYLIIISYYQNPSQGRIILRNPIVLNCVWVPAAELSFTSSTVVTYSSIREVIVCAW